MNISNRIGLFCVAVLHVVVFGLAFGRINIPILRPLLVGIYLSFVPGLLLLAILEVECELDELVIYGITLSWSFLLGLGALFEFVPVIVDPLSRGTLIGSLAFTTTSLLIFYIVRFGFRDVNAIKIISGALFPRWWRDKVGRSLVLYGVVCLELSFISTVLLYNRFGTTLGISGSVLLIGGVPFFIVLMKDKVDQRTPVKSCLVIIAIGLLYLRSLISPYVNGIDVLYNVAHVRLSIVTNEIQLGYPRNYFSILTPHILAPTYHYLGGLSISTLYKFVVPAVYGTVVVLGLNRIYRKIGLDDTDVNFAILLVLFNLFFFSKMPAVIKQVFAEIFLISLVVIGLQQESKKEKTKFTGIALLFGAGMVVSHYGTTWIFIGLTAASMLLALAVHVWFGLSTSEPSSVLGGWWTDLTNSSSIRKLPPDSQRGFRLVQFPISLFLMGFLVVLSIEWFSRVGQGQMFAATIKAVTETLSPQQGAASANIARAGGISRAGIVFFQFATIFLIGLGMFISSLSLIIAREGNPIQRGYFIFTGFLATLGVAYVFSGPIWGLPRYLHLLTLFAAPYAIIGFRTLVRRLTRYLGQRDTITELLFSLFLVLMLLFNAGVISSIANEPSVSLYNTEQVSVTHQDIAAGSFLLNHTNKIDKVFGDALLLSKFNSAYIKYNPDPNRLHLLGNAPDIEPIRTETNEGSEKYSKGNYYLFFHSENTKSNTLYFSPKSNRAEVGLWEPDQIQRDKANKIYDSSTTEIWKLI